MKLNRKDTQEVEIDMSPMIDMVFLLLIFFIVASQIVKIDKVPIEVPSAIYAKVPEDETGRYPITVDVDGNLYVGLDSQKVTLEELTEQLAAEIEADPELRVLIRADRRVKYKTDEEIMEACAEAGANDMIFAAFEK